VHVRAVLAAHAYSLHGRPRGADAGSACLVPFAGPGWLAAGDAALSFDPLSSQGILTSLYTGMLAGQALHAHLSGESGALARYLHRLGAIGEAYWRNRAAFYAYEARWPERPFWRRRSGMLSEVEA
jgi:flavin-dependent dehydrogenase